MKTSTSLFAACSLASTAFAGTAEPPKVLSPVPPENPLSFFDGKVTFEVQERLRWEVRENNFDFNDNVRALTDDNWLLHRFHLGVILKPSSWLRVYAQVQDAREILSDRPDFPGVLGAEGDDAFDLRQGYVEISNYTKQPWGLKIGRQVLEYGDGRLVGPGDWSNFSRSSDAVKLRYQKKSWSLEAFASTIAVITRGKYNQSDFLNGTETHREQVFSGLYFSTTAVSFQTTDLYAFHLHEDTNALYLPAAIGNTNFVTLGARVKSKPGVFHHQPAPASDGKAFADGKSGPAPQPAAASVLGLDYTAEIAFQTGEVRGLDLTAFAAHGSVGYTFDLPWIPRLGVEYNYASGDDNSADGDIQTFQNLFPSNHPRYGFMDLFSWQNIHNPVIELKVAPCKNVIAQVNYHLFWLANNDDVWYRSNATTAVRPLNALARNADTFAGAELDFTVTWKPLKQLALQGGYSHFFAGDYLKDTGAHDDADFGYLQTTIEF